MSLNSGLNFVAKPSCTCAPVDHEDAAIGKSVKLLSNYKLLW
jgi:hypothetical protein